MSDSDQFRNLSVDEKRLYFWRLAEEKRKSAQLEDQIRALTEKLAEVNADLTAHRARTLDYEAMRVRLKDTEKAMQALESKTLTSLERANRLVECLQWTRDRDRTWRGVAVATVNEKLDEVIRG